MKTIGQEAAEAANLIVRHIEMYRGRKGYAALGLDEIREVAEIHCQSAMDKIAAERGEADKETRNQKLNRLLHNPRGEQAKPWTAEVWTDGSWEINDGVHDEGLVTGLTRDEAARIVAAHNATLGRAEADAKRWRELFEAAKDCYYTGNFGDKTGRLALAIEAIDAAMKEEKYPNCYGCGCSLTPLTSFAIRRSNERFCERCYNTRYRNAAAMKEEK